MATDTNLCGTAIVPRSVVELREIVGRELGPTTWHEVSQARIDAFAQATEDFQWIHVDVDRAAAGPLGTTIAHGLYTLSLGPKLTADLISFEGFQRVINYGFDRVRFTAPVPSGSRLRMRLVVSEVGDVEGGAQVALAKTFECEGAPKPVCVANALVRLYES